MWQGICTFLCTFYACMTSFLNLFSAVRQCLPTGEHHFLYFTPRFPALPAAATKISVCQADPVYRSYFHTGIFLQLHLRNILFPPSAIFHRAIHIALCSQCTACRFLSIVPDTFLPDPPASPPRCTFLPLFSALLYNFPLLLYCHAGTYTT